MATAVSKSWKINSLDISSAFLQGDHLIREVYLRPPSDICNSETIWRLKRCIYGLNDAPRAWYNRVKKVLVSLGGKMSIFDQALFTWHEHEMLLGLLASHVDDFIYCGTKTFHDTVIAKITATFKISFNACGSFKYLGLNVVQNHNEIRIDQMDYIQSLQPIDIDKHSFNERLLDKEEKSKLRSLSGQLAWIAGQTRPDIAFENCQIANCGKHATVQTLKDCNKALRKLKNANVSITIPKIEEIEKSKVVCYTDASHANLKSGASQGAYIILLERVGKAIPITWQSKKLRRVTKSPLASETSALSEGVDASYLVASMIQEIFLLEMKPKIVCVTDSKSLFDTLKTSNMVKDLRLRVDIAGLRQMTEEGDIEVDWIKGGKQIADCMTKCGASPTKLLDVLNSASLNVLNLVPLQ